MCSFIILISKENINKETFLKANNLIKSRGPNSTNTLFSKYDDFYFASIHNLLDISGFGINQPLTDDAGKILLFNGENYKPTQQDMPDSLLLLKEFQQNNLATFLKKGLGEFAMASVDFFTKGDKFIF